MEKIEIIFMLNVSLENSHGSLCHILSVVSIKKSLLFCRIECDLISEETVGHPDKKQTNILDSYSPENMELLIGQCPQLEGNIS